MASIAAVFQGCSDSLKSILASQDFGSEYELLCTELSIQWLRVRLWGESVGLEVEENDRPTNHILNRRDIEKTVTQTVHSIAYILSEIEIIRRKYDLRPLSPKSSEDKPKTIRKWKSFSSLFSSSNPTVLQQRMQENQKQKSFLAIAKWANSDAKKFEEKIKALKSLIDGLESISQAAGVAIRSPSSNNIPASTSEDAPPAYTPRPRTRRRATEGARPSELPMLAESSSSSYSTAQTHYAAFKAHLTTYPPREPRPHRGKLTRLSEPQLDESVLDIYYEVCRRQSPNQTEYLPEDAKFVPKRNAARKKLGALKETGPETRFSDLVADVAAEMVRRFPTLDEASRGTSDEARSGRARAFTAPSTHLPLPPPPPSSHSSHSSLNITPPPSSSSLSKPPKSSNLEITKSFRCSPHDQTYKVLPAALKKYGIDGEWRDYRLVIACGKEERVLGMEERPLGVFRELMKKAEGEKGERPVFMLRKENEWVEGKG